MPIGHIAHLGRYLKIFSLYMHFIFFRGHKKQFHVMCKGGHSRGTPQANACDLGVRILTVLEGTSCLSGDVRGTAPYDHDYYPSQVPWHKEQWLYDLYVGNLTVFKIFEHLQFKEYGTTSYGHDVHTNRCYLTQETRIYTEPNL
jgi:hypothetical protein